MTTIDTEKLELSSNRWTVLADRIIKSQKNVPNHDRRTQIAEIVSEKIKQAAANGWASRKHQQTPTGYTSKVATDMSDERLQCIPWSEFCEALRNIDSHFTPALPSPSNSDEAEYRQYFIDALIEMDRLPSNQHLSALISTILHDLLPDLPQPYRSCKKIPICFSDFKYTADNDDRVLVSFTWRHDVSALSGKTKDMSLDDMCAQLGIMHKWITRWLSVP